MQDDKDKRNVVTHRVTVAKVTQKAKPAGDKAFAETQKPNAKDSSLPSAKPGVNNAEQISKPDMEIPAPAASRKRVATVDNIMLSHTPEESAADSEHSRGTDIDSFQNDRDDERSGLKSYKPRRDKERIPAWSIVLLFSVIAVLAAILLYFFVLKNDNTSAPPTVTQIDIIVSTPTITPTEAPTITPTEVPTITPEQTPATMWGANFPGKFTGGEILTNDSGAAPTINHLSQRFQDCNIEVAGSYKSAHVNVTVNKVKEDSITYYVADIYITDLKYLTSAFSNGKYKGKTDDVYKIAQKNNAIVAVNGDFYTRNRGPVLRNSVLYRNQTGYDMLAMLKDGTMQTYAKGDFDKDTIKGLENDAWQIWTFGPMLLQDGQTMTKFNLPNPIGGDNPRTAIGYYEPGHYVFVTVDGRQPGYSNPGYSMKELSQLMYDLGCKVAFNLDGGASAQMAFMGKKISHPCWRRRDPDAICIIDEPAPEESAAPATSN